MVDNAFAYKAAMKREDLEEAFRKNSAHINPYGYYPLVYVCAIFLALFSLSTGTLSLSVPQPDSGFVQSGPLSILPFR